MQNKNLKIILATTLLLMASFFCFNSALITEAASTMSMHFIDVGQGDCEVIQTPGGKTIVIDGGESEAAPTVISFLKKKGIKKIDYMISSHGHADHVGAQREILRQFPTTNLIDPCDSHKNSSHAAVLKIAKAKGVKIIPAKKGNVYNVGGAKLQIVYCNPRAEDINNTSVVAKITYGQISGLFTGDLESAEERNINTTATILKVGHHGSKTSTTVGLLDRVKPKAAIISCGQGNSYGHPHSVTMQKLTTKGIKVYRTDKAGTITVTTDGKTYQINAKPSGFTPVKKGNQIKTKDPINISNKSGNGQYIGNKNSHKFHQTSCSSLPSSNNRIYFKARREAVNSGYVPCKKCNP